MARVQSLALAVDRSAHVAAARCGPWTPMMPQWLVVPTLHRNTYARRKSHKWFSIRPRPSPSPRSFPKQPVLARARQITARRGATRRPLPLPSVAPDDTVHTHSVADSVRLSQALAASRTCSFRRFRSPFSRRSLGARAADRIIPIP